MRGALSCSRRAIENISQEKTIAFIRAALETYPEYASLDLACQFATHAIRTRNPQLLRVVEACLYNSDFAKNNQTLFQLLTDAQQQTELAAAAGDLLSDFTYFEQPAIAAHTSIV